MAISDESAKEDFELLAPWLHTGKLAKKERTRLAAAAARNPELARRLALVAEEARAVTQLSEAIPAPSRKPPDTLFARIAAEEARARPGVGRLLDWLAERFTLPSQPALAWGTAAVAIVALVEAGVISAYVIAQKREGVYHMASREASAGERLLIGFAPSASMNEVIAFLADQQGMIVDGPHSGGVFSVRFGEKSLSEAERAKLIAKLKAVAIVRFVAPERSGAEPRARQGL